VLRVVLRRARPAAPIERRRDTPAAEVGDEDVRRDLVAALATVPDPRGRYQRRHPLPAILAQVAAAHLDGETSLAGIAAWGRRQNFETVRRLGYIRDRTPALATLRDALRRLDTDAVEAVLSEWARARLGHAVARPRSSGGYGEEPPALGVLAAYVEGVRSTLA